MRLNDAESVQTSQRKTGKEELFMMNTMRNRVTRLMSLLTALVMVGSMMNTPAMAAKEAENDAENKPTQETVVKAELPTLSATTPIACYPIKTTGTLQAYKDSSLKEALPGKTLNCRLGMCHIIQISKNGNAVKVSYPTGSLGKRGVNWFKRSDFTVTKLTGEFTMNAAKAKVTTYTRSDGKTVSGYIGVANKVYLLGTADQYQEVIYPVHTGGWKLGWITAEDFQKSFADVVDPDGVKLNSANFTLEVGKTKKLAATVTPANTTNPYVTWLNSNEKIATIDKNGTVTAVAKGTATISAMTGNGKKASVKVTVKEAKPKVEQPKDQAEETLLKWCEKNLNKVITDTSKYAVKLDGVNGIKDSCVWYVRNRGYEKLGKAGLTGIYGDAGTWMDSAKKKKNLKVGAEPKTDSIACWKGTKGGFIAYVEYYDAATKTVYFSEAHWGKTVNGTLKKLPLASFKARCAGYQGCIYLGK